MLRLDSTPGPATDATASGDPIMSDDTTLLTALQHADSFFPGGGIAFSWGLESLCNDRQVASAADVERFLAGQLRHRWASCDRPFLAAAHRAAADLEAVAALDRALEAMTLPREMRDGSTRAGGALLTIHDRLDTAGAGDYRRRVRDGAAPGHLPVVQGLLFATLGLDARTAAAMSAHMLSVNVVGAALRLSVISHIDAQRILTGMRSLLADILRVPAPDVTEAGTYTPMTDAAVMRHEVQQARLFAN
jgi:urease accessory protein